MQRTQCRLSGSTLSGKGTLLLLLIVGMTIVRRFLKPFTYRGQDDRLHRVDAPTIIAGLGTFPDETLRCPARYAARLSQAFTATNETRVELDQSQVLRRDDI